MNGLWWLSSNCGAKNRLHRIPLDKSVFSCEAQRNPCPSLGCLSNLDNPRHIKLHLSLREPRSSSAPQMDFIFWPCHQFTHDLHRPETSVSISPVSPDYRCVLWRTERPQRTTVGKAEMNLSSTMDCRCYGWSGMKHYNLAPVMRSDRSLCSRAKGGPKLLAVATTLPLSSRHGGPCVLRAVSLMVPWALCGTRDPHALHRVVTLSEKCTAESSWMVPSRYCHVFPSDAVDLTRFMEYVQGKSWVMFWVKGQESHRGLCWSVSTDWTSSSDFLRTATKFLLKG